LATSSYLTVLPFVSQLQALRSWPPISARLKSTDKNRLGHPCQGTAFLPLPLTLTPTPTPSLPPATKRDSCKQLQSWQAIRQFKKLLTPGKIGQILCLGNLTDRETYEYLRTIAADLQLVKGDFDVETPYLTSSTGIGNPAASSSSSNNKNPTPASSGSSSSSVLLSKVITHGSLRIGFTHSHTIIPQGDADALLIAARQMDVDVLLWGGTHRFEAYELEGKFFVNPGSATGALSSDWGWGPGVKENGTGNGDDERMEDPVPSFCLMDVS
jgi:vacuolar protein sorting-associated protein 29